MKGQVVYLEEILLTLRRNTCKLLSYVNDLLLSIPSKFESTVFLGITRDFRVFHDAEIFSSKSAHFFVAINFCVSYLAFLYNSLSICFSSSLIDVIFVKQTSRIAKSEVLPMLISDHDMTSFVYKMNNMKFTGLIIRCKDYRNYNPEQLQKDIRESNLSQIENIKSANNASLFFKYTLIDIFQKHAPEFDKKSQR